MSDIQQRIADAIQKQAELNMDCDRDIDQDPHSHWLDLAAAAVSELGLAQEWGVDRGTGSPVSRDSESRCRERVAFLDRQHGIEACVVSRFITEWVPE